MMDLKVKGSDVKSKVFFSVLFTVFFLLAASIMPYVGFEVPGTALRIVPDILFSLSIAAGIVYERNPASVIALIFGFMSDVFITPPVHLSPLLFFLGAYYSSKAVGAFTRVNCLTATVASIPFFLLRTIVGGVYLISRGGMGFFEILKTVLLPELAMNVISMFFVYIVVSFLYKRFKRRFYI